VRHWLVACIAALVAASSVSAQSQADTLSAVLYSLERVGTSEAAIPVGVEVLCFRGNGGLVWPDSVRGGEAIQLEPLATHIFEAVADSLSSRIGLPHTPECPTRGAVHRITDDARLAVLLGSSSPHFFAPDSAVFSLVFAPSTTLVRSWTCRIRRAGAAWVTVAPCFESVAQN